MVNTLLIKALFLERVRGPVGSPAINSAMWGAPETEAKSIGSLR